jgi:predicted dehydrogenase
MADKVRVGVIGCGAISHAYLSMAKHFPILEVAALADLDMSKAEAKARDFNIPRVCSVDQLLADDSIEVVLNLTVPKAHVPVALQALAAGKHTYAEKPLGVNLAEGKKLVTEAKRRKLRVGCAPDTFMGAGVQTARKLLDEGAIGRPVAFTAFVMGRGHESWHPSPEFYYEVGGGPMFDMGPYYLTALLQLLGPMERVGGMASIAIPERTITSQPKFGKKIQVETPDHICGSIEFKNGAVGTIIASFATMHTTYDPEFPITIYGTEGTLRVPDPNGFDGRVMLKTAQDKDWREMPHTFHKGYGRMVGVADLCHALRSGRPHRASLEQAFSVLEAMQGFLDSSEKGKAIEIKTDYERPPLMPADLPFGTLD